MADLLHSLPKKRVTFNLALSSLLDQAAARASDHARAAAYHEQRMIHHQRQAHAARCIQRALETLIPPRSGSGEEVAA